MKFSVIALLASPACTNDTDASIFNKMIGTWSYEEDFGESVVTATQEFKSNGIAYASASMYTNGKFVGVHTYVSRWQVEDGDVTMEIISSTSKNIKVGRIDKVKVLSIDDKEFNYIEYEIDKKFTLTKIK